MTTIAQTQPQAAAQLYRYALTLLKLPPGDSTLPDGVRRVMAESTALDPNEQADSSLQRWGRAILDGRRVTAGVHLDRAGLALGLRPSQVRRPSRAPRPTPPPPQQPKSVDLSGLNASDRALIELLPGAGEPPLAGASALAERWGATMSPTSARGRYSRLANKLRDAHARDVLLRGKGCYGRAS